MDRQPVHVVYGGAQLFQSGTFKKVSQMALSTLQSNAGSAEELDRCLGLDPDLKIFDRIVSKLSREAIEDYRIDFEDGYGSRPNEEEDRDAERAASELAQAVSQNATPPLFGVRVKSLQSETRVRSFRTLELFLKKFSSGTAGVMPTGFLITLPKVESVTQVADFAERLALLEKSLALKGRLKFEVMIETPALLMNRHGACELPLLVEAAQGRLVAAHFGAYDYTAALDIASSHQNLAHPACDHARQLMKLAFAGTVVRLSDGATNIMPIGPNRAKPGQPLSVGEFEENRAIVHAAWKLSFSDITRSLSQGFYQGWDLHPAQIPVRYAAVYSFFLKGREAARTRLKNFVEKAAQANLSGNVFDDEASGQGLLNFFLKGFECGAFTEAEILATGLTLPELRGKSFAAIARARRA